MSNKEAAEAANGTGSDPETHPLNLAEDGVSRNKESTPEDDKVRMKKELGLLDGVAIILGIIIGSGNRIEMSPAYKNIRFIWSQTLCIILKIQNYGVCIIIYNYICIFRKSADEVRKLKYGHQIFYPLFITITLFGF